MDDLEKLSEAKDTMEAIKFLEVYLRLQDQINNPTREGMIKALSEAQTIAPQEIASIEQSQGDIYLILWESFSDKDLYRKLKPYQQGLFKYAVKKFSEEYIKSHTKSQNQKNT